MKNNENNNQNLLSQDNKEINDEINEESLNKGNNEDFFIIKKIIDVPFIVILLFPSNNYLIQNVIF
jgi:hypothetical protein